MRKFIPLILFLLIIISLICHISHQKKKNTETASHYTTIDFKDFKFINPVEDYELNEHSVICFFSSTCALCSYEAKQLKKEKLIPENIDFIWVSSQIRDSITTFVETNHLADAKRFKFAQIDSAILAEKYNVNRYPKSLIYKNGILCHSYKGIISLYHIKEIRKV